MSTTQVVMVEGRLTVIPISTTELQRLRTATRTQDICRLKLHYNGQPLTGIYNGKANYLFACSTSLTHQVVYDWEDTTFPPLRRTA